MFLNFKNSKLAIVKGFTLIELLVVVAIISLLSSVVLSSLNSARMKARDAKRLSDLHQMRIALNLYYNANGFYPDCPVSKGSWESSTSATWNTTDCLVTALRPTYMSQLPIDPKNNATSPWNTGNYSYAYRALNTGQNYDLVGQVEDTSNPQRCQVRNWIKFTSAPDGSADGAVWCVEFATANYLIADH